MGFVDVMSTSSAGNWKHACPRSFPKLFLIFRFDIHLIELVEIIQNMEVRGPDDSTLCCALAIFKHASLRGRPNNTQGVRAPIPALMNNSNLEILE